jgi:hypothetical protein
MSKPRQPKVLEHGWTRQQSIPDGITAKQAQEQIEYDNAVRAALKAMGY